MMRPFVLALSCSVALVACGDATPSDAGLDANAQPSSDASASADAAPSAQDASPSVATDATSRADAEPAPAPSGEVGPIECPARPAPTLDATGLPLLESNPGAPVALYLDFNGGTYGSSSGPRNYSGYNRPGSSSATFDATEQADIVRSWEHVTRYYAMFDVNVTTSDDVRRASNAWGWILVTEDASGGSASLDGIGRNANAKAYCGAASVRDADRSRRIAHELGHNFTLEHSGVWEGSTFYKWEDWPAWDRVYGPIMGGGGEGRRNGWARGRHEGDPNTEQDEIRIIRDRIVAAGGRGDGWHADDFATATPARLCASATGPTRSGVIERFGDEDSFWLDWSGGTVTIATSAPEVSSAIVEGDVMQGANRLGGFDQPLSLPRGVYVLRVRSRGDYTELGAYSLRVVPQ